MSYFCHIISLKMDNAYGQLMGSKGTGIDMGNVFWTLYYMINTACFWRITTVILILNNYYYYYNSTVILKRKLRI